MPSQVPTPSTNVLPQISNLIVAYSGSLLQNKWLSFVYLNGTSRPCSSSVLSINATNYSSGVLQAAAGTTDVTLFEDSMFMIAAPGAEFSVCYSELGADVSEGWYDSYIHIHVSKIASVISKSVTHKIEGQIAFGSLLPMAYTGQLDNGKWFALVNDDKSSHIVCSGDNANSYNERHSGVISANLTSRVAAVNTSGLSAGITFAVCYAETNGTRIDPTWHDSGIRVTTSEITEISYGSPARIASSSSSGINNLLPRAADVLVTYAGSLAGERSVSLVAEIQEGTNPCVNGTIAAHVADSMHSGQFQGDSNKVVTLNIEGLSTSYLYALCYTNDAIASTTSPWRDSYIRYNLQKLRNVNISGAVISTSGTLSMNEKTPIEFDGTLLNGKWLSVVDATLQGSQPCLDVTSTYDQQHSGIFEAALLGQTPAVFSTTLLNTPQLYAVCYAQVDGTPSDVWIDSGIRLRFVKWTNTELIRVVSGSITPLTFKINTGTLEGDIIAVLPASTSCASAPAAPWNSNGVSVKRIVTAGETSTAGEILLHTNTDEMFLQEGNYIICLCNRNGLTDDVCGNANNVFISLNHSASSHLKILNAPRLGSISMPGDVRTVSTSSTSFHITGSSNPDFSIQNGDQIFFAQSCDNLITVNYVNQTAALGLTNFSSVNGAAKVTLPSATPLEDAQGVARNLKACFATQEASVSATGFVSLTDSLVIIPAPRLGLVNSPGTIRAVAPSTADFLITPFADGDLIFFREDSCTTPPEYGSSSSTVVLSLNQTSEADTGTFSLPSSPLLSTLDGNILQVLKACFAAGGTDATESRNWIELHDTLELLPEPTGNLITEWRQGQVREMTFDLPDGSGRENDIIVLQPGSCDGVQLTTMETSTGVLSAPIILSSGAVAKEYPLAAGRVNTLDEGTYKICYATASSGGDSQADYTTLSTDFVLLEAIDPGSPTLSVPQSILLGIDLVVEWSASNEMNVRAASPGGWVGLYKTGECLEGNEWQHRCFLAYRELSEGTYNGVARFLHNDYQAAGEYEVRYFRGDTQHGQGRECKGLGGLTSGVYLQCKLIAAATSTTITISPSLESRADILQVPGLEHVVLA